MRHYQLDSPMHGITSRSEAWCKATGMEKSDALATRVLPWIDPYGLFQNGFDHSFVYYHKASRTYVLLTEPYWSVARALATLNEAAAKHAAEVSVAIAYPGQGVWRPYDCPAMLIARPGTNDLLNFLAAALPWGESE